MTNVEENESVYRIFDELRVGKISWRIGAEIVRYFSFLRSSLKRRFQHQAHLKKRYISWLMMSYRFGSSMILKVLILYTKIMQIILWQAKDSFIAEKNAMDRLSSEAFCKPIWWQKSKFIILMKQIIAIAQATAVSEFKTNIGRIYVTLYSNATRFHKLPLLTLESR